GASTTFDKLDEHHVDFTLQRFKPRNVVRLLRQEGIEHRLVLARGVQPPLDAEFLDQSAKAERPADHADRTDDRRWIADDLVARTGDHVAAGRRNVLDEYQIRQLLLVRELTDPQIDLVRLHR